jgi:alpha-glucosidase
VLKRGSLKLLRGAYNILSYGRFSDEQQIAVVFNNNTEEQEVCVPVWQMGVTNEQAMNRVFYTDMEGFSEEILIYPVKAGEITIRMPARSAAVLLAQ